jgi:hypothetical protein
MQARNQGRATNSARNQPGQPARPSGAEPGPRLTTIDIVNKWLTALQSIAIIAGVAVALWQLSEIIRQNGIQADTLKQTQQAASASLVLQLRDKLDASRYDAITAAIQGNDQHYPLLSQKNGGKGGKFRDLEIESYMENFEDIGYLVQEHLILAEMAYDHFSYEVEKAWCNADVQRIIRDERKADKSVTAASDPFYGRLETLAKSYLARERQTCKDLDNQ